MKNIKKIYPVILCGGSGTRLWPLSRKSFPKQFSKIIGNETLFQATCKRFIGEQFAAPTIVTNEQFRFTVRDQLYDIGIEPLITILEPSAKNTSAAVLAATLEIAKIDPNGLILVLPSDHSVKNNAGFIDAIKIATNYAVDGAMITFGIKPTHPETGYGYLEVKSKNVETNTIYDLKRFVEKPSFENAQVMLNKGNFLWNGGVFFTSVGMFEQSFQKLTPQLFKSISQSMNLATLDLGFVRPEQNSWDEAEDISIDYSIMERSENLKVVPIDIGWNDLGDWKAVWSTSQQSDLGVATAGSAIALDCKDTLLRSEKEELTIVGIGLENVFAVAMNDAVVIGSMDRAQDVKKAVDALKKSGKKQASEFPRDHRPWGWYETLVLGDRFQVKRIVVKPGAALSLQSHVHRAEHWTVVEGTARVTVDEMVKLIGENQSVYIPLGAVHRMENPGKIPLTLIEVQSGSYLGEDDIIRYEDQFGRK